MDTLQAIIANASDNNNPLSESALMNPAVMFVIAVLSLLSVVVIWILLMDNEDTVGIED